MRAGGVRWAGAALAGLLSLAAAGWSVAWQIDALRLTTTRVAAQIAPLPAGLPSGVPMPPPQPPLTAAERYELDLALWRSPLDPRLFNLLYADAIRTGRPPAQIDRLAGLLGNLGWRYTPTQQNLLIRAILEARFGEALDRVDALLRRQKLAALSYTVLATMEATPQVHGEVLNRLALRPAWRRDYLSVIGPQSGPSLLDARVRTMAALLGLPAGMSRDEMAPSLRALAASGRGRAAYGLWMRRSGRPGDGDLVYDPGFRQAAFLVGAPELDIPFEWRFAQDLGYAVQVSPQGVTIDWDRRGVPIFASQVVPVRPGRRYILSLRGEAGPGDLRALLAPTLTCGQTTIRFEPVGDRRQGDARYRIGPLPTVCDMATLAIGGGLDTGSGGVTFTLFQVRMSVEA